MASYSYKSLDQRQKVVAGTLEALSEKDASDKIQQKGLKIIYLQEVTKEKKNKSISLRKGFSVKEKIAFCRYFSLLMNSGLPLSESFELLIKENTNPLIKKILKDISASVNQGNTLYDSFAKFPKYFDDVFLAMVKTGETSASLSDSFEYLYKQYKQENSLRQKVVSALIYPVVIISMMCGIGLLMFVFVLPKLATTFLKLNVTLPLPTKILLETSLFFQKYLLFLFLGILVTAGSAIALAFSPFGKKFLRKLIFKLPLVKVIFTQYNLARFTQSLAALMKGGVPVLEALSYSLKVISGKEDDMNQRFEKRISEGMTLADAFAEEKAFPSLVSQMIAIGEKSGDLDKILVDLSVFYQEEVENSLKNFIAILEPVIMVVIGIAVGVMVLAVISPIYSLIGQISPQ